MAKNNSRIWFRKVRGSYLPNSGMGLLIYLFYVAYLVALVVGWYAYNRTAWGLISAVIPLTVGAALVTQYIASKHSR